MNEPDIISETGSLKSVRDENGALRADFVRSAIKALEKDKTKKLRKLLLDLHESDLADFLEQVPAQYRSKTIEVLGKDFDFTVLTEIDEIVRDELIENMPNEQVAAGVRALDTDDAIYVLEDLGESEQTDILAKIPEAERATLEKILEYPEDSAGRIMQAGFIAVPPFWSVGQTIDYLRDTEELPTSFSEIYVVDPLYQPVGYVPLDRILRTQRPVIVSEIAETDLHKIEAIEDQEEVARQFERYNLFSTPVVDETGKLTGVVTVDDIVEVIQEEAEEDIHRLGGVGDESITDTVMRIAKGRFTWLFLNLATAILASVVIGFFDATIEQMVALAILMPIVASMGGNAGTQTMTVAVRALATKELGVVNAWRVISREALVGVFNGVLFALIIGVVAYFWFNNMQLGLVIGAAMLFNMIIAALAGILIPLLLDWYKIDPAIASSVFVTTVTDVVGFLAFLGLAAFWLV